MNRSQLLLALVAVCAVPGCGTKLVVATPTPKPLPIKSEVNRTSLPPIGTTVTMGIGEALLTQGDATSVDFIIVPRDQEIGTVTVRKGKYPKSEQTSEYRRFRAVLTNNEAVRLDRQGSIYLFSKDEGTTTACVVKTVCGPLDFTLDRTTSIARASSQQTLLYSGKIGNRITLGYREFSNDAARPAFNNDVAYDLSESKTLGYKGARLEVIRATNTEITYKVIAGFN